MKNRVAYFGVFTALALIFSYVESLIPISIGISVVCGQSTTVRIHIWKLFQYHLQPGRWIVKSDGNGTLEEEQRIQCDGNQCGGRSVPQCGTADRCNACGGDIQCWLLFLGASGRRTDYRTGDRDRVGGNVEEN